VKAIAETVKVSRTDQYRKPRSHEVAGKRFYQKTEDDKYIPLLRKIVDERMTYGYRRVTALLNRALKAEGQPLVNHKRIYRIMKMNNLLLQRHAGRAIRVHDGRVVMLRSNRRWCSDAFEIACWNGGLQHGLLRSGDYELCGHDRGYLR
jgi:putative transposase